MKIFSNLFGRKKKDSEEIPAGADPKHQEAGNVGTGQEAGGNVVAGQGSGDNSAASVEPGNKAVIEQEPGDKGIADKETGGNADAAQEPGNVASQGSNLGAVAPQASLTGDVTAEVPSAEEVSAVSVAAAPGGGEESPAGEGAEGDSSADSEAPATDAKKRFGGLGKMWEATRRLALTPVDPWFAKMAQGLNKTRQSLVGQVKNLLGAHSAIDDELWDELEDILLTADVGIGATERTLEELRRVVKEKKISDPQLLTGELKAILGRILGADPNPEGAEEAPAVSRGLKVEHGKLMVVLMVGVNGAGKTTTTAKIAALYKNQGYKVLMAAADTFRAAAIDQLQVWADRIGVDLIRHQEGADPAAVVYDAVAAAKARGTELLLVDTAGRLHNKTNLMEELRKIKRVAGRDLEGAPHEILLVLDATTGQNALEQARVFNKVTELTGLILCKLDGTSRGGIIVAIAQEFSLPVRYIGVGEAVDDLREFEPGQFLAALFSEES